MASSDTLSSIFYSVFLGSSSAHQACSAGILPSDPSPRPWPIFLSSQIYLVWILKQFELNINIPYKRDEFLEGKIFTQCHIISRVDTHACPSSIILQLWIIWEKVTNRNITVNYLLTFTIFHAARYSHFHFWELGMLTKQKTFSIACYIYVSLLRLCTHFIPFLRNLKITLCKKCINLAATHS